MVGEDTRQILSDIGYADDAIDKLFESGAVNDQRVYPALADPGAATVDSPWAAKK